MTRPSPYTLTIGSRVASDTGDVNPPVYRTLTTASLSAKERGTDPPTSTSRPPRPQAVVNTSRNSAAAHGSSRSDLMRLRRVASRVRFRELALEYVDPPRRSRA